MKPDNRRRYRDGSHRPVYSEVGDLASVVFGEIARDRMWRAKILAEAALSAGLSVEEYSELMSEVDV